MLKELSKILFVEVLYGQKYDTTNVYNTFLSKLSNSHIFIFDNSPTPQHTQDEFREMNVYYVSQTSNPGLSYAYNRAAEYAKERAFEWMMILDQDTFIPPQTVADFTNALSRNAHLKLFVPAVRVGHQLYMSPVKTKGCISKLATNVPRGVVSTLEYMPINSGMIVSVDALLAVGGYNEKVWLDHSDYQFMKRFNRVYTQMFVLDSECEQEFSNIVQTKSQKLKRFEIFCDCIKNCEKDTTKDTLDYLHLVVRRTLSLVIATRSISPITIVIKKYFL